ncbi:transposase family protein [Thermomonospora amylolytica]|uniref:transposase family protein n=1 Tax=Thermomonospora amylolytica TaxID=1411117 RepID=UPI003899876A
MSRNAATPYGSRRVPLRPMPHARSAGLPSTRVHSRYRQTLRDLAACGRPLVIELKVRRFLLRRDPRMGSRPSRRLPVWLLGKAEG